MNRLWSTAPEKIDNIRQIDPAPKAGIEDATDHLERLRARGAFPERIGSWWRFSGGEIRKLVKGYYGRSLLHRYEGARHDLKNGYLFTNEPDYHSAIASIEGAGGAYVGVGQMLSYTYPAWQGAAHAYNIDVNARVPMVAIPLYGILLAMAADRFEFLSLIYGRPIPKTEKWARLLDGPADVLVEFMKRLPRDASFENSVRAAVRMSIAGRSALYGQSEMADLAMGYLESFRQEIDSDRPSAHSNVHPLSILKAADEEGRGGTLSGEGQLRRERDIFIDGRITGVASPMQGEGLSGVARDMVRRGVRPRVIHISNVEDWLFDDLMQASRFHPDKSYNQTESDIYGFYQNLDALCSAEGTLIVSAKGCYPTVVEGLGRYVANSIPLEAPLEEAVRSASFMYELRKEETRVRREPLYNRPKLLEKYAGFGKVLSQVLAALREGWRRTAISRGEAEAGLLDRSRHFRETLTDWERGAVLRVLEDVAIVKRDEG